MKIISLYVFSLCLFWSHGQLAKAQSSGDFEEIYQGLLDKHVKDGEIEYARLVDERNTVLLPDLIAQVAYDSLSDQEAKAFLINAYNALVIYLVVESYPAESVRDIPGFFTRRRFSIDGKKVSLNDIEKSLLLKRFPDARLHLVLVCGARDCPGLRNEPYEGTDLEAQLTESARRTLRNRSFIRVNAIERKVEISPIFKWYRSDFGKDFDEVKTFINSYRAMPVPDNYDWSYYDYDWNLNKASSDVEVSVASENTFRYIVSATIPKGGSELKLFNNLYSQLTRMDGEIANRDNYFTSFLSYLYGYSSRFNIGFDIRLRSVHLGTSGISPFDIYSAEKPEDSRLALATIGPKIRWAPLREWGNFGLQSALWFPLYDDLEGSDGQPFLDWNGISWYTQLSNDFDIGTSYSFFGEVGILGEDLGFDDEDFNRWTVQFTGIYSYFPTTRLSFYSLGAIAPTFWPEMDIYGQLGVGTKYQVKRWFEMELLYTLFTNANLIDTKGRAQTINLGLRLSG